jgi:GNAT superfamily N-acetyltransferase
MERCPPPRPPSETFTVRPLDADDEVGLDALLTGLDTQSRYRRWFSGAADVHRAVVWAAHPELNDGIGLVATSRAGDIIGHGAAIPMDADRAEVCFEVAAPWRHHGVAGRLLTGLAEAASERGLRTLVAEILSENADMLAVMREHGPCRERSESGVVELELDIAQPPARTART